MQLIAVLLITLFLFVANDLKAQLRSRMPGQDPDSLSRDSIQTSLPTFEMPNWKGIDVDFLNSYYAQDGNNSPVTGGIGTEQLTDFTQKLIVTVPLKKDLTLSADGGYDYYSSASTDNIDPARSDDSASDVRTHANVGISYDIDDRQSFSARLGGSIEYDYWSSQVGLGYTRRSKGGNTVFNAQGQAFIDYWSLIYPIELRNEGQLVPTNARQSFNLALGLTQVLDKKTQIGIQLEGTFMNGLLSTPFHRVYLQGEQRARVERLPMQRLKIPVGVRLNRYLTDWLVARAYYRFYWDDWGMVGHSASLELPFKVNRFLSLAPFYRYHTQTAADYFAPYRVHVPGTAFYTSDFDLSALQSHSFGLGVNYQPAGGIAKLKAPFNKERAIQLKSIDLKYAHYRRSTGLQANIVSFGMGFTIK